MYIFSKTTNFAPPKQQHMMEKEQITPKTREEIFREKATNYLVCYSSSCPLRDHCLRNILSRYVAEDQRCVTSINLTNPKMQCNDCPEYRDDTPVRMPYGLSDTYYDMPGRMERSVKNHLISVYSRKRYYQYHNGTRPLIPDVESYVRQTLKSYGWTQEPQFAGYVEEYLW